jgi:hypothetical protein
VRSFVRERFARQRLRVKRVTGQGTRNITNHNETQNSATGNKEREAQRGDDGMCCFGDEMWWWAPATARLRRQKRLGCKQWPCNDEVARLSTRTASPLRENNCQPWKILGNEERKKGDCNSPRNNYTHLTTFFRYPYLLLYAHSLRSPLFRETGILLGSTIDNSNLIPGTDSQRLGPSCYFLRAALNLWL